MRCQRVDVEDGWEKSEAVVRVRERADKSRTLKRGGPISNIALAEEAMQTGGRESGVSDADGGGCCWCRRRRTPIRVKSSRILPGRW